MKQLLLSVCLLLATLAGKAQVNTDWYTTGASPFTITTAAELAGLAELVNRSTNPVTFEGKTILLGCDIDLTGWLAANEATDGWLPIGWVDNNRLVYYFQGHFNGGGHTISGLWINRPDMNNAGLFHNIGSTGKIDNLTVVIDNSDGKGVKGNIQVGGLVGVNEGEITNCAVKSLVAGVPAVSGTGFNIGGLVANNVNSISNCYATVGVSAGGDWAGGLVGANKGSITNCYATGAVTGSLSGGLVGYFDSGTITASFFDNTVNSGLGVYGEYGYGSGNVITSYGLTTTQMKTITPYTDTSLGDNAWTFTGTDPTWAIDPLLNNGYPILRSHYPTIGWYVDREDNQTAFTLTTAEQLAGLALLVNAGHAFGRDLGPDTTFTLGCDIDLTPWLKAADANGPAGKGNNGGKGWMPIGKYEGREYYFQGCFDGAGHTISGLWIDRTGMNCVGLFGLTGDNATLDNLNVIIDNSSADKGVKGNNTVGGLVGWNKGEITNCAVKSFKAGETAVSGTGAYIGGLVGGNFNSISNCYATVAVSTGGENAGGMVGANKGSVSNCYATGAVVGSISGGLVGGNDNYATISNCYATGTVTGTDSGGLVGVFFDGTITASFFDNTVNSSKEVYGHYSGGTITNSEGLPTEDLKLQGTFSYPASWNFAAPTPTWAIDASGYQTINQGYPYLTAQRLRTVTLTQGAGFAYTVNGIGVPTGSNLGLQVLTGDSLSFTIVPQTGYTADNITVTATALVGGKTTTLTPSADGLYTLSLILGDADITVSGVVASSDPQPSSYTVTLIADPGILLLPSAGTHGATIGGSFTFYVTLAEGFEGRTPQATVNGDPVPLTLRPGGKEWMYVIQQVYDDTRVVVSFATTGNEDLASGSRLYSRDGQLLVETPVPTTFTVYTASGQALTSRRLAEGLTTLALPRGVYVVRLGERVQRVVVK